MGGARFRLLDGMPLADARSLAMEELVSCFRAREAREFAGMDRAAGGSGAC